MRVLLVLFSILGSVAFAGEMVTWDEDLGLVNESAALNAPVIRKKPVHPTRKPLAAATPAPVAQAPVSPAAPTKPTPAASTTPVAPNPTPAPPARRPRPVPTDETTTPTEAPAAAPLAAPRPAPAPAPAPPAPKPKVWQTKYKCEAGQTTNHIDDVGDMIENSLGFQDVYAKKLVSPDGQTSFQLAQNDHQELQVIFSITQASFFGTMHLQFDAPAVICEQRPGVLVAVVRASERRDCVPLDTCQAAAGMIKPQYVVTIGRNSPNSVAVSSEGMPTGVYHSAAGAQQ